MPAGRKTTLTPEIIEDVRRILPTVLYLYTVSDYIAVPRRTFWHWIRRGKLEEKRLALEGGEPSSQEAIYLELLQTIKRAIAEGEFTDASVIRKATEGLEYVEVRTTKGFNAQGDEVEVEKIETTKRVMPAWQAAAWRLERRFPERWGANSREIKDLQKQMAEVQKTLERAEKEKSGA